MSRPVITVGIPVFNEGALLRQNTLRLCQYLETLGNYELLLGSNGSTDATVEIGMALAAQNPRIRFFEIPERKVGRIFQTFLLQARGEFLISVDMDLSTDLDFIPKALELLKTNHLVIGSKKMGSQSRSFVRRAGSGLYILCAQRLLDLKADDYSMGAKGYRVSFFREFAAELGEGTTYVVNCIYLAGRRGAKVAEIPVLCQDFRKSKFNLPREAYEKYSHLLGLWWLHMATRKRRIDPSRTKFLAKDVVQPRA